MTKVILARTWFECGEYQRALDAINEAGYKKVEPTSGYSYALYMQALSIRGTYDINQGEGRKDAL